MFLHAEKHAFHVLSAYYPVFSIKFFSSYQSTNSTEKISKRDAIAFRFEVHIATNYLSHFGNDFVER